MSAEESHSNTPTRVASHCTAVAYLTHWATRLITRELDRELRALNISSAQLAPLLLLSEHGSMLQRDMVKLSAVAQPAMVATLTKLEQDGLIERHSDQQDRRASLIVLTHRGQERVKAAYPALLTCNEKALAMFSREEQESLIGLLSRLIASMEERE